MTWVPSEAKKVAICCCALRAMAFTLAFVEITVLAMKSCGYRFRAPGPGKGVGFTGNRRLVRTKVAWSAKSPARSMAATPGLGTTRSPLANWMITDFGGTPGNGRRRMYGA